MTRRHYRRRRRPKVAETFLTAIAAAALTFLILAWATQIAPNAAAMAGAFAAGIVVGHSLPTVRVIWRRR